MAQIIKHRRGSIANVGNISPVNVGEIILGTGSIGNLVGPVLFVGDASSYKAVPQLYYGSSAPDISTYSQLEGVSFYNSTDKNLYILKAAGNTRLDLAGAISGSAITPLSITTGIITGSNLYLSGNAVIDGNLTLGGNIAIGNANTDFVTFGADISSSIIPDVANSFDLGATSKEWRTIYAQQGVFTSASGSFSGSYVGTANLSGSFTGSFVGDGAGLTGLVSTLSLTGSNASTGSVSLKTQGLTITGATNEINTSISGQTVTVGLVDDPVITGDITINGNDIRANGGLVNITLSSNTLTTFAGDIKVMGNDISSSTATALTLAGSDVTVVGDLTVTGNDIKSSTATALTLAGSDVTILGDLQVSGNDIKSSTGATVLTLSGSNASFASNLVVGGNLTVNGTSTIVNSTTVEIGDNIISLNGTGATNAGLVVRDVTASSLVSGSLLWDTANDYWIAGGLGSEKRIAVQNAASLTTNALIFGNASSQIVSMTAPSAADQYALWNGSAWTMTNVIDGGTF
jgi:hypothetical protein